MCVLDDGLGNRSHTKERNSNNNDDDDYNDIYFLPTKQLRFVPSRSESREGSNDRRDTCGLRAKSFERVRSLFGKKTRVFGGFSPFIVAIRVHENTRTVRKRPLFVSSRNFSR